MVNEWDKTDGDRLSATELDNIREMAKGNGILSGLDVTEAGTPSLTVNIAAGTYIANNTYRSYAGGTKTCGAADGTNDRYDVLSGKSDGTITLTAGTAAADPLVPTLPANEILIAILSVPANDTTITNDQIYECGLYGGFIRVDGANKMRAILDMDSHQIDNVTDPTAAQDAATKAYVDAIIPSGTIVMWHGTIANIPTGWVICDGNNSTPNLLDKFVKSVTTAVEDPGSTGGTTQHRHKSSSPTTTTGLYNTGAQVGYYSNYQDHLPPYYEVAFIMKT